MNDKYAVIDLGSNSIRMNLIRINEDGAYILFDQIKEMVRLSEGMQSTGKLQKEPMDRTIFALKLFKNLLAANKVTNVHCLATAAVRMADNQDEFLNRVQDELDFKFRVLSGEEEAYFDYLGVINSIDLESFVMIDIGGGSTEIAYIKDRKLINSISFPFGSVILSEKFMDKSNVDKSLDDIRSFIKSNYEKLDWLKEAEGLPVVGLGGVIRTLAKVDLNLNNHQLIYMHNYKMDKKEVKRVFNLILNTENDQLKNIEGINKPRADIILGGIMPLEILFNKLESKKLVISGNGLRDGFFYKDFYNERYGKDIVDDVLNESLKNIKILYDINEPHSDNVNKITMKLYDCLKSEFELKDEDRKILDVASKLHDIGMYIEYFNHHIHGFYLMLNSRINGLSNTELISVALLVGSHRDKSMKKFWEDYASLITKERYQEISRLSLILKLAEKLDRSEAGIIKDLVIDVDDKINIACICDEDPELEIIGAMSYNQLFKKTFSKKLNIYEYKET